MESSGVSFVLYTKLFLLLWVAKGTKLLKWALLIQLPVQCYVMLYHLTLPIHLKASIYNHLPSCIFHYPFILSSEQISDTITYKFLFFWLHIPFLLAFLFDSKWQVHSTERKAEGFEKKNNSLLCPNSVDVVSYNSSRETCPKQDWNR